MSRVSLSWHRPDRPDFPVIGAAGLTGGRDVTQTYGNERSGGVMDDLYGIDGRGLAYDEAHEKRVGGEAYGAPYSLADLRAEASAAHRLVEAYRQRDRDRESVRWASHRDDGPAR